MTSSKILPLFGAAALLVAIGCGGRAGGEDIGGDDANLDKGPTSSSGGGAGKDGGGAHCPNAILCVQGTWPTDTNGDGCEDACEPVACPPVLLQCKPNEVAADLNGDGCIDGCKSACNAPPPCAQGMSPADYDGDGCFESCKPQACPPVVPQCKPGEGIADLDGDGCALECIQCPAILCAAGTQPIDKNGDGCDDGCK